MRRIRSVTCAVRREDRGFTLIELMIVVAIVAVLAAIAYPAYTNSVVKGKRAQGRTAVVGLLQQEERYFTQNNSYVIFGAGATSGTDASGSAVTPLPFQITSGDNPSQAAYNLTATQCAGITDLRACVKVIATPRGWTDAAVPDLYIESSGLKGCTGSSSACWSGS